MPVSHSVVACGKIIFHWGVFPPGNSFSIREKIFSHRRDRNFPLRRLSPGAVKGYAAGSPGAVKARQEALGPHGQPPYIKHAQPLPVARLAQSVERKALNLVVVGSSPTVGVYVCEHLQLLVVIHTVKRGNGPHQPDGLSQAMPWSTIL